MGVKITHGRLRPKPNSKNNKKATRNERDYLQWFSNQDLPCFACGSYENGEGHHIKENSCDGKIHTEMLPLCSNCHRLSTSLSAHVTPKQFRLVFPIEVQRDFAGLLHNRYLKEIG